MFTATMLCVIALATAGFVMGRRKAVAARKEERVHSLPGYHCVYVAMWTALSAALLCLFWVAIQGPAIDSLILNSLPDRLLESADTGQRQLLVSEIKSIADGRVFGTPDEAVVAAADRFVLWHSLASWAMFATVLGTALVVVAVAYSSLSPQFRARHGVEKIVSCIKEERIKDIADVRNESGRSARTVRTPPAIRPTRPGSPGRPSPPPGRGRNLSPPPPRPGLPPGLASSPPPPGRCGPVLEPGAPPPSVPAPALPDCESSCPVPPLAPAVAAASGRSNTMRIGDVRPWGRNSNWTISGRLASSSQ